MGNVEVKEVKCGGEGEGGLLRGTTHTSRASASH